MAETVPDTCPSSSSVLRVSPLRDVLFPEEWYALALADHFWCQWRLKAFQAQCRRIGISQQEPLRVLDVGGGSGVLRCQLEATSRWVVDVTDLCLKALEQVPAGRGRKLYYDVREERAPYIGAYDLVVLFDVLEHIEDTKAFLRPLLRHLKPGGILAINVPALPFLMSAYDRAAGHFRRYTEATLRRELSGPDSTVLDVSHWGLSLIPLLAIRKGLTPRGEDADRVIRFGFRPPGRTAHAVLKGLMRMETSLLPRSPTGTSLLLAARRTPL